MARFDRQIAMALRLIKKNGEPVIWRSISEPTPTDPATPWAPGAATYTDHDVIICFLTIDKQTMETFSIQLGSEVPKGMVMGLMGDVDFEPNIKDVVIRHGKELNIFNMDVLSPNGQTVLYTMVFRT